MLKLRKNKKGFTLVELIVVIAIMAVLAGTVAGVTVSQLNKQTDKTMASEAKGIADFISTWIVEHSVELPAYGNISTVAYTTTDTTDTENTLVSALQKQYDAKVITSGTNSVRGEKGKSFGVALGNKVIYVQYQGKQGTKGDITYQIDAEGVVKKVPTPGANDVNIQAPADPKPDNGNHEG